MDKPCLVCKKVFSKGRFTSIKEWNEVRRFCSRECKYRWMSESGVNTGKNNAQWKGGTITVQGYRSISVNGKRVLEHRYVMEQYLGRKLEKWEQVHHKNKNKLDNRVKNLQLLTIWEHAAHHAPKGAKFGKNQVRAQ